MVTVYSFSYTWAPPVLILHPQKNTHHTGDSLPLFPSVLQYTPCHSTTG